MAGATGLSESEFVSSEEKEQIAGAEFHGQVGSSSGSSTTVEVVSLVTHDQHYGCRSWTGSYEMTDGSGRWLIEHATLTPRSCSG
jgi:hypothetical protein